MEKKWIWLVLFGVAAVVGGYLWWTGKSAAPPVAPPVAEESGFANSEAPALGTGGNQVQPSIPGARNDAISPRSPFMDQAPPPGFGSEPPPPSTGYQPLPNQNQPIESLPGDPPPSAFEPVPQQNFENPDFVTPPPPPSQFDSEPVPFDDDVPPGPFESGVPGEPFEPPPEPED